MNDYDLTTEDIINGLMPLINDDRLTGKLAVDGVLVLDTQAGSIVDPIIPEYDNYGFSLEQSAHGCVRMKPLDERIADWLANGDEFQKAVAESTPQWLGLLIKGREYTDEQVKQISANNQAGFMFTGGLTMQPFCLFGDLYIHKETGETASRLTPQNRASRMWKRNPNYRGAIVPNHRAIGWGNNVYPDWPDWEEHMTVEFPVAVLAQMDRLADRAREAAGYPNAVHPNVSPNK